MFTFLRAQATSVAGSAVDFLATFLLVSVFHIWYVPATITGNVLGGITQFSLARTWAFHAEREPIPNQVLKYLLVWLGNIALSAVGIYLLTEFLHLHYIVSKLIISLILGLTYNYLLQKHFVFR